MVVGNKSEFQKFAGRFGSLKSDPNALVKAFPYKNGNAARDVAYLNVVLAQSMFDPDGSNKHVDVLIEEALGLEMKALEISDDGVAIRNDLEELSYLFGSSQDYPEGSAFAQYIHNRTMDLLLDQEERLDAQESSAFSASDHEGRSTHYSGDYKTAVAENLKAMRRKMGDDKVKVSLMLALGDSLSRGRDIDLDIDG